MSVSTLYNNFKNLIGQFTYTKSEIDTKLDTYISDTVSDNDMRPVTSNAVYEEINDINEFIEWSLEQEDNNQQLEQEVEDLQELVMWIMNQDLDKDLETKLEQFLEEE